MLTAVSSWRFPGKTEVNLKDSTEGGSFGRKRSICALQIRHFIAVREVVHGYEASSSALAKVNS
jgi:hypothetical protein